MGLCVVVSVCHGICVVVVGILTVVCSVVCAVVVCVTVSVVVCSFGFSVVVKYGTVAGGYVTTGVVCAVVSVGLVVSVGTSVCVVSALTAPANDMVFSKVMVSFLPSSPLTV